MQDAPLNMDGRFSVFGESHEPGGIYLGYVVDISTVGAEDGWIRFCQCQIWGVVIYYKTDLGGL